MGASPTKEYGQAERKPLFRRLRQDGERHRRDRRRRWPRSRSRDARSREGIRRPHGFRQPRGIRGGEADGRHRSRRSRSVEGPARQAGGRAETEGGAKGCGQACFSEAGRETRCQARGENQDEIMRRPREGRSEERRVGKEFVSKGRTRWAPYE